MLASTGAATADMVIPAVAAAGCVNIPKAFIQQGITDPKKIVSAPLCLNGQVATGLGGDFPKWTYLIASSLFGDTTDPGMIEYMKRGADVLHAGERARPVEHRRLRPDADDDKVLNQVGYANLSPSAILGRQAFKGPQALGAPALECGKYPNAPGVCNNRSQFFEYDGKNKWVKTAGWIQPPTGCSHR